MKLLEIEVDEYTTPEMHRGHKHATYWEPITVKIKQTDENAKIIGKQLQKQIKVYEGKSQFKGKVIIDSDEYFLEGHLNYKFVIDSDEWLLEGCWLQNVDYFTYKEDSYMEATVRFDNATPKGKK